MDKVAWRATVHGGAELDTTDQLTLSLFEHSLALRFFGTGEKTDLFQSCGHCWVFHTCWHTERSTLTASSFRVLNSSAGIPPPPLALFIVMLPKAHLTSYSRMSGSRWVTTPSWLSGSWRSFLYSFSVYSCHLPLPFLSFIMVTARNDKKKKIYFRMKCTFLDIRVLWLHYQSNILAMTSIKIIGSWVSPVVK